MGRSSGAASKSSILPSRSPSATWKPKGLPTLNRKAGSADFEGRALRGWRFANVVCEPKPRPGAGRGRGEDMKGLRPLHASPNGKNRFVNGLRVDKVNTLRKNEFFIFSSCIIFLSPLATAGRRPRLRGWRFEDGPKGPAEPEPQPGEAEVGASAKMIKEAATWAASSVRRSRPCGLKWGDGGRRLSGAQVALQRLLYEDGRLRYHFPDGVSILPTRKKTPRSS